MKMSSVSYNEFLAGVVLEYENDLWRDTRNKKDNMHRETRKYGRVYVDCLEAVRPKIANKLQRSLLNPSMRNNCPPGVHKFVEKLWDKSIVGDNNLTDEAS